METQVKWCTYGAWGKELPTFIGKLEKQEGHVGYVRYTEKQLYPVETWDMDYVKSFTTLEEAILYLVEKNCDESVLSVKEWLNFPSDTKNLDWNSLRIKELDLYVKKYGKN